MAEDKNKHIVNSIEATINCGRQDLLQVQKLGLASCIEQSVADILPLLDLKFENTLVRLDRLSIELDIKKKELSDLNKLLAEALTDALKSLGGKKESKNKALYQEAKNSTPEEVFFHFLKYGQMPWYSAKLEWDKLDFSNPTFTIRLTELLKSYPISRERLISQFTADEVQELLLALYPSKTITALFQFTSLITENAKQYSERFAAGFRLKQLVIKAALAYFQNSEKNSDFNDFLKQYWTSFSVGVEKECNGKHRAFLQFLGAKLTTKFDFEFPKGEVESTNRLFEKNTLSTEAKNGTLDKNDTLAEIWEEKEGLNQQMIVNVGIVLLHPFLTRFFDKVGLLEKNQFISLNHQQRGICLLHHLATGELVFPEEKLLFFKHLCNYPLKQSVPRELPISDFERVEAEQLLQSTIAHWTALKNTSKEGLRVNFLQRKGLLDKDALGYTLHVETHAADVLLDQLPWGLSVVHFSWLPSILTIKWR